MVAGGQGRPGRGRKPRSRCPRVEEFPFSSERKRMTTIHTMRGRQAHGVHEGRAGSRAGAVRIGAAPATASSRWTPTSATRLLAGERGHGSDALRVLARRVQGAPAQADATPRRRSRTSMTFLGLVGMMDPPREEAIEAVKVCRQVQHPAGDDHRRPQAHGGRRGQGARHLPRRRHGADRRRAGEDGRRRRSPRWSRR